MADELTKQLADIQIAINAMKAEAAATKLPDMKCAPLCDPEKSQEQKFVEESQKYFDENAVAICTEAYNVRADSCNLFIEACIFDNAADQSSIVSLKSRINPCNEYYNWVSNAFVNGICSKYPDQKIIAIPSTVLKTTTKFNGKEIVECGFRFGAKFITYKDFLAQPEVVFARQYGLIFDIKDNGNNSKNVLKCEYGNNIIFAPNLKKWRKILTAMDAIEELKN